jgi:hypothetical protein
MKDQTPIKKENKSLQKATVHSPRQERRDEFRVVLKEGGSSSECYGEACDTEEEAMEVVTSHKERSYNAVSVRVVMSSAVSLNQEVDIADAMAEAALAFTEMQRSVWCGQGLIVPR